MKPPSLHIQFCSRHKDLSVGRSLPFIVSWESECKCDYISGGKAVPTIWPFSMESTWGRTLCWQRTKQGTKWTPGQIKIHQDIWIGCPGSKLCAGIKSKVKWNVPLLHISAIIMVLECAWHTPERKKALPPSWYGFELQRRWWWDMVDRVRFIIEGPPCFFSGDRPAQCGFGGNHCPCLHLRHLERCQQWAQWLLLPCEVSDTPTKVEKVGYVPQVSPCSPSLSNQHSSVLLIHRPEPLCQMDSDGSSRCGVIRCTRKGCSWVRAPGHSKPRKLLRGVPNSRGETLSLWKGNSAYKLGQLGQGLKRAISRPD